ncbi:SixA phosphatase family protein [Streptomyces sp. NPDC060048]|uniref:SixA phosphatase family protein n=1 Tax=unclassified Streptomyces TaxID=2593676 RepID=UPI0036C35E97
MPSAPAPRTKSSGPDAAAGCRLLLVRHAKAVPKGPEVEDFERALSERGRADAPRTGAWLAESGHRPELVLCSPARRTSETWQLLVPALPVPPPPAVSDERLYKAEPNVLATVLTERAAGLGCVALVGHNPGLHAFASALCGSGPPELLEELTARFVTSGLAVVDLPGWDALTPGAGRLTALWSPHR